MSKIYETVIGLEVHVELATKTKIFCGCSTAFGGAPNTHTCPVCTGMPGSLPVLNRQVVEYAMAVGIATNCSIPEKKKGAVGVRGMKLGAGDALAAIYLLNAEDVVNIEVKGKEVALNRLRTAGRDTKGTKR